MQTHTNPIVSIIIPCFNQAQYLDDALESVLSQTIINWECIIINDGSPDNTKAIALKWVANDNRFKYIEKENGGLSSARNTGIRIAVGQFIQFLDCDDLIEKNKLANHLAHFSSNQAIDVSVSGYRYFKSDKSERLVLGNNNSLPETVLTMEDNDSLFVFNQKNPFVISAPLYKKEVFNKVGLFDEELKALEDKEFHLRCALLGIRFCHMGYNINDKTLIRLHSNSMMNNREHMSTNTKLFIAKRNSNPLYLNHFEISPPIKENSLRKIISLIKLLIPPIIIILIREFNKKLN